MYEKLDKLRQKTVACKEKTRLIQQSFDHHRENVQIDVPKQEVEHRVVTENPLINNTKNTQKLHVRGTNIRGNHQMLKISSLQHQS